MQKTEIEEIVQARLKDADAKDMLDSAKELIKQL